MTSARAKGWLFSLTIFVVATFATPRVANAYVWMIRYGDTKCTSCHTDPSGSAILTANGRLRGDLLMRTRYQPSDFQSSTERKDAPSPLGAFAWGGGELPEEVRFGADLRGGFYARKPADHALDNKFALPRADVFGDIKLWRVRAAGSLGFADGGSFNAALTRNDTYNLVSREHWIGIELDEGGSWLLRGGRIALPFGVRTAENSLWVRSLTRTNIDDQQQYGAALAIHRGMVRAEVMGILGNYQIKPDDYRERGYSAYLELSPPSIPRFAAGVSGLFTRARRDLVYRVSDYRHAYGLFARYAPIEPLVFLAEADWIYESLTWNGHRSGYAALLQSDWEMARGIHFILTGETKNNGAVGEPASWGGWVSAMWFFAPHADLRVDNVFQTFQTPVSHQDVFSLLFQLHVYL
ncbi:MAG: hypothetical protein ABW133_13360 [Polyangiaceae bacterium]